MIKKCIVCNNPIKKLWRKTQNFCSVKCQVDNRIGKHLPKQWKENIGKGLKGHEVSEQTRKALRKFWTGKILTRYKREIIDKSGYILIKSNNHPFRNGIGYVRRSRLVMEKKFGRYLKPKEVIHHINGIVDDDRIENLKLFSNNGKHIKFHKSTKNKIGQFI